MKTYDPWEDKQCIAYFCEKNSDEFDQWFHENANHPAKKEHYELDFCEANAGRYLDFASNYND